MTASSSRVREIVKNNTHGLVSKHEQCRKKSLSCDLLLTNQMTMNGVYNIQIINVYECNGTNFHEVKDEMFHSVHFILHRMKIFVP